VGIGYDIHRLVPGRRLVLGGVTIPNARGLCGHSDADVLLHAACDALLGAAAAGDIGTHFPDGDPRFKDVDSMKLLAETARIIHRKNFVIRNLDGTILAEAPRIGPYRRRMEANIARALDIDPGQVNVKATTLEGIGALGRGEGIAALCIALLEPVL
jgi:2-C-methyl-D-erythritol 2,4-cyclodiphosphate synthase